jgi:hypothetical protein
MGHRASIAHQSARVAALVIAALILLNATASHSSETQLAFLSNSEKNREPAIEIPTLPPPPEANAFDGRWIFTGGGCRGAGSVSAVIKGGKVIVRGGGGGGGGNVTPDGIIHTIGAGNGLTLTAEGRLMQVPELTIDPTAVRAPGSRSSGGAKRTLPNRPASPDTVAEKTHRSLLGNQHPRRSGVVRSNIIGSGIVGSSIVPGHGLSFQFRMAGSGW